jgi:hypothetical protein
MMIKTFGFVLMTVFLSMPVVNNLCAQEFNFPDVAGFKTVQEYPVYTPGDLWDYINGAADAYLSYGFSELYIAEYVKGKNVIKVEVYDHLTPMRGFGIYSLERSPDYSFFKIGGQGYFEEGLIHFFKDRYYVKVVTNSQKKGIRKSLEIIARRIAEALPGVDEMPAGVRSLPSLGRLANEEMYINESVLGHSFLRGSLKAVYETDGKRFTLYLFENESVEKAADVVSSYLKVAGIERDGDTAGKYQFRDGYNGVVYLIWNQSAFAVITGLDSGMESFAGEFCSQIPVLK